MSMRNKIKQSKTKQNKQNITRHQKCCLNFKKGLTGFEPAPSRFFKFNSFFEIFNKFKVDVQPTELQPLTNGSNSSIVPVNYRQI